MTKQQKVDYINKVYERMKNTKNHGLRGSDWWNPVQNTIAYDVKMKNFFYVEEATKLMTPRQLKYYSEQTLQDIADEQRVEVANDLAYEVEALGVNSASYAGRSGGWLEVGFKNNIELVTELSDTDEINNSYDEAVQLEKLVDTVGELITKRYREYNKYVGSTQFYKDFVEMLSSDKDIEIIYREEIKDLMDKLK